MLIVTKALVASGVAALAMSGTPLPDSTLESQVAALAPAVAANPAPPYCPGGCNLWGTLGSR
ncbi:hypothetical protein [Variovorax sp. ZT4R33]|uniref:hypothetical protein n=1 Tax=Variovorax sp. ZT4R33 TaxID=3443743 RepID=UPI003F4691CD